ncbi:D-arabinono-1,4-lactone oxidase [Kineococcus aurantiacus]|uniref:FAD/FMN-containing dehydrogenase n=1 Tax=Kineococcus aurantiacus TaxID=37633 RepID=A0A7Y9DQF9_9ACTN|nr:D-arabinono-1,4-lactone oxidase [Kineococcus aurantiacus]NYD24926.1 FAD/FMN-containing dehydrogenase [Kineococcus aurantiacus]
MSTSVAPYPRRSTSTDDGQRIWNWARNSVIAPSAAVVRPTTEAQLREAIASSTGRVRLTGSRMSAGRMLELAGAGDRLLDTTGLRGLLTTGEDSVTFAGGTPLQEVYDVLTAMGRMLPSSPGVIASQTLAGALATGTHGQGLRQSSIGDAVLDARLVLADGSVAEFDRDHPSFPAVQLGLGLLGAVSAVTLRTVPSLVYTCAKEAVSAGDLGTRLPAWNRDSALTKAWWFPDEDLVHVWTAREADEEERREYEGGGRRLVERGSASDAMNRTVEAALANMRGDTRLTDTDSKPYRTVKRFKDFTDVTGDVYQVFCRGIATPQINVEIGVPLERAGEVVAALKEWHARTRPHMHYPIILRCTGPSTAWLSPSHGQETVYFGFVVYYAEDGTLSEGGMEFLRAVEEVLAVQGGRPHWGKYFEAPLYDWRALYPRWDDFRRVRDELDPTHRFANAFADGLFE